MSKKNGALDNNGYVIHDWSVGTLEGRLLTMVESWGLKDSQEKAIKDLVRQEVWKILEPCFVIAGTDLQNLVEKYAKDKSNGTNVIGGVGNRVMGMGNVPYQMVQ